MTLTDREKALVEAARAIKELYGTVTVDTFNAKIGAVMVALRAYDPPKPKVYTMPSWEEFSRNYVCGGSSFTTYAMVEGTPVYLKTYNAIRELTAKEQG